MTNNPNDQPIPPLPAGPLNAPIHGPRLPGHPGPGQPRLPGPPPPNQPPQQPQQFVTPQRGFEPTLPVVPTSYPSFWRTPAYRVWRPIVVLVLGLIGFFLVGGIGLVGGALIGQLAGGPDLVEALEGAATTQMTPWTFLGNNIGLALLIPTVIVLSILVFKQGPGWICSVAGRLRWGWLGRCLLLLTPLWLIYTGIDVWLAIRSGSLPQLAVNPHTVLLIVGILATQPLQSAGEEFIFRGLANRGMAAFFANQRVGLVVGAVFSSVLFMLAHGAGDLWLNVFYFFFGAIACLLTWWTGGLEAAIAMHVINNLLAMWPVPFSDISRIFERSAGAAGPEVLIGLVVIVLGAALLGWQAKRQGLARHSAPARSMIADATAAAPGTPLAAPAPASPAHFAPAQAVESSDQPLSNPRPWQA